MSLRASVTVPDPDVLEKALGPSPTRLLLRRSLRHVGFIVGATIVLATLVMALFAPWLSPADPYLQDLSARIIPPVYMEGGSWAHPLGTDHLGRDYLSRIIFGARVSLIVGICSAAISAVIGVTLGVVAGYFGGWVDSIVTFVIAARLATPVILVALAIAAVFGSSAQILVLILGLLLWDRFAIVMRSSTQQLRDIEFVEAARSQGCSVFRIMVSEILPNLANAFIVILTLEIAHAIILEAALSFLGLGVRPPLPSWGLMVSEGRESILFDPWLITIPGVFLFLLVLAINLLGDGIRDVLIPDRRD